MQYAPCVMCVFWQELHERQLQDGCVGTSRPGDHRLRLYLPLSSQVTGKNESVTPIYTKQKLSTILRSRRCNRLHGTFIVQYNEAHHIVQSMFYRNPYDIWIKIIQIEIQNVNTGQNLLDLDRNSDNFAPCEWGMIVAFSSLVD